MVQGTGMTASATQAPVVATSTPTSAAPTTSTTSVTSEPTKASGIVQRIFGVNNQSYYENEGYDGWYNNLAHPDWGGADMVLTRRVDPAYADGVYHPSGQNRPNPFTISRVTMKGESGHASYRNKTALMTFFGQQVVEEILDAQRAGCPPEYFNIPIPPGELFNENNEGGKEMPLRRGRYNFNTGYAPNVPREQLNEITPWFDGGLVYGTTKAWADALRSHSGGKLACDDLDCKYPQRNSIGLPMANPPPPADHYLKPVQRFYKLGNPRGDENPFLLTMGIFWFRVHNHYADWIRSTTGWTSDEKIFNRARQWTIAAHQKIVIYDWLPVFLGLDDDDKVLQYQGYKRAVHPGVTHIFQSAAMRFGHTLVPPGVIRRSKDCEIMYTKGKTQHEGEARPAVRTCNSYWNPQDAVEETDIEPLLMGMASQITEREDNIITPDLRESVFGPLEFSRRDLMAVNIQRGREHGLPDYNTARRNYGLKTVTCRKDINPQAYNENDPLHLDLAHMRDAIDRFVDLHATAENREYYKKNKRDIADCNIFNRSEDEHDDPNKIGIDSTYDNMDIWPAGILETTTKGPGSLFHTVILDQFLRIRDGDRFWFENSENGLFTDEEVQIIKNTTFASLIKQVTEIRDGDIQDNVFIHEDGDPCPFSFQLNASMLDACTEMKTFDYYSGSEGPYIATFVCLALWVVFLVIMLYLLSKRRERAQRVKTIVKSKSRRARVDMVPQNQKAIGEATELMTELGEREISVYLMTDPKLELVVTDDIGRKLRVILLQNAQGVELWPAHNDEGLLLLRITHDYDLIMRFPSEESRHEFIQSLQTDLQPSRIPVNIMNKYGKDYIHNHAITKKKRQALVEEFLREVFARAAQPTRSVNMSTGSDGKRLTETVLNFELSKQEFAESMGMKENTLFVEQMFRMADADNSGFVTFRELLDLMIIFNKGSAEEKLRLMFDLYDIDNSGSLEKEEFTRMTKALLEMVNTSMTTERVNDMISGLFAARGFQQKDNLTFEDFKVLMSDQKETLQNLQGTISALPAGEPAAGKATRGAAAAAEQRMRAFTGTIGDRRATIVKAYQGSSVRHAPVREIEDSAETENEKPPDAPDNAIRREWIRYVRFVENYRLQIFWTVMFHLVTILIFVERAYYYSVEREYAGLRRIAGYGVTITRGAASAMAFTYSILLLPMCRNIITVLRETALNRFIPFDFLHGFHKHIAVTALFYTVMHMLGHSINFYHIATQNADDLNCLFRDFYHASDELPKFQFWCYHTLTGVTAILLVIVMAVMYVFAVPYARRHIFNWFWNTHKLYVFFYFLLVLHGCGRLVQAPLFYFYFLAPACLFAVDKLVSASRNRVEVGVVKAEILPSQVTGLYFKRPANFDYKSGQWVRIACLKLSSEEYHPFTLSSAPHEELLSLHIRSVGPWTNNLRKVYDVPPPYPKLYLDGPFGEGHQDWHRFGVSVMVGGGIGVTPFASILKDVANQNKHTMGRMICNKLYFIWVTRTQKQFEWFTEMIREVEDADENNYIDVHIFITQFYRKFDLRTTMLYVCERHFERVAGRSLFTGLRSVTHFGRPPFEKFLNRLKSHHNTVPRIGVFSCGPPPMTKSVEAACSKLNEFEGPIFNHHFENF
jgi:dual oxidase